MTNTKTNGSGPGLVAHENDYGLTTPHSQSAKISTTNTSIFKSKLIATYARFIGSASGFSIDRGIGIESIMMIVFGLVYAYVKVTS
jgi:hypothetical protein